MKILVFGKNGQIATELRRQAEVVALDRVQAELTDPANCEAVIAATDADVIINAAAYTSVDGAEQENELANLINGEAPAAMACAAAIRNIPFLHISTDYVFDGSGLQPFDTDSRTGPLGAYGRSKLLGELGVSAAGGPHAILRTSWVFSPHGANFVKTMLRIGAQQDRLSIVADQIGGPTAAADIAAALLKMAKTLQYGEGRSGVYHFAGIPNISWAGFAREIFKQSCLEVEVVDISSSNYPTAAMRPYNSRLDCSSVLDTFEISRPDWRQSLAIVLNELKAG